MKLPNIKETDPPHINLALKCTNYNDDAEFKEQFNASDSYFKYLFKKGIVLIRTKNRRYFCKDGVVHRVYNDLPDIKEIAPSESGYPVKDYSLNPSETIEIDLVELQKSAEKNQANYDDDGNRIAFDADGFC